MLQVVHTEGISDVQLPPSMAAYEWLEVVELSSDSVPVELRTLPNLKHLSLWGLITWGQEVRIADLLRAFTMLSLLYWEGRIAAI